MSARGRGAGPSRVLAARGATTQERVAIGSAAAAQTPATCRRVSCLILSSGACVGDAVIVEVGPVRFMPRR
jgi:hypothetical protein